MTYVKQLRNGDMLRFFGDGEGVLAPGDSFGPNSLMPGVVSLATRLDLIDSASEISQLGYASARYNRTANVLFESSSRIQSNSAAFLVSTNFSPTASANPGFSINQEVVDATASTLVSLLLNLQTRRAFIRYNRRINRRSRIMRGLTLRELLRYASAGCSTPGSIN